jgi:hypothetical protein
MRQLGRGKKSHRQFQADKATYLTYGQLRELIGPNNLMNSMNLSTPKFRIIWSKFSTPCNFSSFSSFSAHKLDKSVKKDNPNYLLKLFELNKFLDLRRECIIKNYSIFTSRVNSKLREWRLI